MKDINWEQVGIIGVDAGLCWIGDPCYIMGKDTNEQPAETWEAFCDLLQKNEVNGTMQWNYKMGHAGLGVTVSTGWGDGEYPVFIKRNKEGRIAEVKVVFDTDDNRTIA